jgi:hypothetical protein
VLGVVADHLAAGGLDLRWDRQLGVGLHQPGVEQRCDREHLLHRAGLVDVAERPGRQRLGVALGHVVRVVRGIVGQGEQLAGDAVEHDRHSTDTTGVLDGLAQHPLDVPLQVPVDGERQVLAVDRLRDAVVPQRHPVAATDVVGGRAVGAAQQGVEPVLDAGDRLVLGVDVAEDVRRDVLGGIAAHRVPANVKPLVAGVGELLHDGDRVGRRDATGDVAEPGVRRLEPLHGLDVVDAEPLLEDRGDLGGVVLGLRRVGDHHRPVQ